jgi:hypothetical protein
MVPGLAGMAEVPYGQFAFYNAAGGLLWGTGFVLLGYFAGAAWQRVAADASKVGLALLVLVLVGLVLGRVMRNIREHGERPPDRLARLVPVAWGRGRFSRQCAWLARRIDTGSPSGFGLSVVVWQVRSAAGSSSVSPRTCSRTKRLSSQTRASPGSWWTIELPGQRR